MLRLLLCLILLFVYLPVGYAQKLPHNHFAHLDIPYLSGQIKVDGDLNDTQWSQATDIELNYVTRPFENTQAPVSTKVKIFENGETLYLAFTAKDPEVDDIRAFYRDRDGIWGNDLVGVKLDTFNDSRLAYQFFVNPLGIQSDAIQNEMTGSESDSWDGIWQSAGKIVADGFHVEMAIPLRILNFAEGTDIKTWGAELVRFYPRTEQLRISNMRLDRNNACDLCQMGSLRGFKKAKQGKNLAVIPTLVMGKGQSRSPDESLVWDDSDNKEVGLDLKWGITPEVSLQATLNPDFSQVEADVAQLSINDTFALFFAEKRTFFLENADYFSSNYNLVYTRNVGSPDYGAKVTGRFDQHTFGLFVANDETTTFLVPGNLGSTIASFEQESVNLALRYRYDLSEQLSIGWTSTLRDAEGYYNYVNGLDAKYQLTETDTLRAQIIRSDTQYPIDLYQEYCDNDCEDDQDYSEAALRLKKQEAFSGKAYRLSYAHEERNWNLSIYRNSRGENIRTDLGFGALADRHQSVIGGGYNWYSENTWWNKIRLSGDWDISHNDNGELLEKESELQISMNGQFQSFFKIGLIDRDRVGLRENPQVLSINGNTTMFTEQQADFYLEMRPNASWYVSHYIKYGDHIDFDNNRLGKQKLIRPSFNWSVGDSLQFNLRHTYQEFEVNKQNLFTANLSDLRATYQFDQRQFLRLILIYSDIERNQQNYTFDVDTRSKGLGTQLLYSYKLNPLTKFFVGYSDSAYQDDVITSLTKNQRSIFMKLSYAWLN